MAFEVDFDAVSAVLLDDGWHQVEDWSFSMDCVSFLWLKGWGEKRFLEQHLGSPWEGCYVCQWLEGKDQVYVPLSLVRAIRQNKQRLEEVMREHQRSR
jgi:hypothetical protein